MWPEREEERTRGPPNERASEVSLDERLREKPTLDMDLMQFLVIARFTCDWEPLYTNQGRQLLPDLKANYEARRARLPHRIKTLETTSVQRLRHYFEQGGRYGRPLTRTLRDLRDLVGRDGGRIIKPNVGTTTFTYLNSAFRYYGIPEIEFAVPPRKVPVVQAIPQYRRNP